MSNPTFSPAAAHRLDKDIFAKLNLPARYSLLGKPAEGTPEARTRKLIKKLSSCLEDIKAAHKSGQDKQLTAKGRTKLSKKLSADFKSLTSLELQSHPVNINPILELVESHLANLKKYASSYYKDTLLKQITEDVICNSIKLLAWYFSNGSEGVYFNDKKKSAQDQVYFLDKTLYETHAKIETATEQKASIIKNLTDKLANDFSILSTIQADIFFLLANAQSDSRVKIYLTQRTGGIILENLVHQRIKQMTGTDDPRDLKSKEVEDIKNRAFNLEMEASLKPKATWAMESFSEDFTGIERLVKSALNIAVMAYQPDREPVIPGHVPSRPSLSRHPQTEEYSVSTEWRVELVMQATSMLNQAVPQLNELLYFLDYWPFENGKQEFQQIVQEHKALLEDLLRVNSTYLELNASTVKKLTEEAAEEDQWEDDAPADKAPAEAAALAQPGPSTLRSKKEVSAARESAQPERPRDASRFTEEGFKDAAFHKRWFEHKLARLSALREPAATGQRIDSSKLASLNAEARNWLKEADALVDAYRFKVTSEIRLQTANEELKAFMQATDAQEALIAALDQYGREFPAVDRPASFKNLLRCVAHAAMLEDTLSRPVVLKIPTMEHVDEARAAEDRPTDVPSGGLTVVTLADGSLEAILEFRHQPANGEEWLQGSGVPADTLPLDEVWKASVRRGLEKWEKHVHLVSVEVPPGDEHLAEYENAQQFVAPSDVDFKRLTNKKNIGYATLKLRTFAHMLGGAEIGRGKATEGSSRRIPIEWTLGLFEQYGDRARLPRPLALV